MNELSWLIYLADVCDKLGLVATIGAIAAFLGGGGLLCAKSDDGDLKGRHVLLVGLSVVSLTLVAVAVPSKDTLYAIAASEMGERVIQSETGGKAVQALNAWLDRQIAPAAQ